MENNQSSANEVDMKDEVVALLGSRPKRFPTLLDMLLLVILFILSSIVGSLGMRLCGCEMPTMVEGTMLYPDSWGRSMFICYLFQMLFMLGMTLLYRRMRHGSGPVARFGRAGLNPLTLLWGLIVMLALSVVIEPLLRLIPDHLFAEPELGEGMWPILTALLLAPLFEELLCRGVLLESLRSRYGVITAWLGSSLFFAIIHLQPTMIINAFVLALWLGYLCLKCRSLWAPMVLHAFNNGMALLMMWSTMPGEEFGGKAVNELTLRELMGSSESYLLLYAVALGIVLWAGWRMLAELGRMARTEKKNRTTDEIIPPTDALVSGNNA